MSTTLNRSAALRSTSRGSVNSGFIMGPVADSILIIGSPLLSLVLGGLLFSLPGSLFEIPIHSKSVDLRQLLVAVFIEAHLFLVYFRSHANLTVFRLHPWRFVAVPIAVFIIGAMVPIALGILGVLVVWWDVYHSSLQTFGFGRIYDSKQKNDAVAGRELDYWMNLLVYTGPVLAGAHFISHIEESTKKLGILEIEGNYWNDLFVKRTPEFLVTNQTYLAAAILSVGVPFVGYYLFAYYRLSRQGYCVSWQKVWLMIITSAVSIYCWGFRSFIDAFWVMNFFHALQYFAIVGFIERRNLAQLFHVSRFRNAGLLAIFWVTLFCLLYGLWAVTFISSEWGVSFAVTTSLMHFWYDGFIWSVQKKQV